MEKSDGKDGASAAADLDQTSEKSSAALPKVMTTDDGTESPSAQVLQEGSENKDNGNPGIPTENMDENQTGADTESRKSDTESSESDSESSGSNEESSHTGPSIARYFIGLGSHVMQATVRNRSFLQIIALESQRRSVAGSFRANVQKFGQRDRNGQSRDRTDCSNHRAFQDVEPPKKFLKVTEPSKNHGRARTPTRVNENHSDEDDMPLDRLQDAEMPVNEVITGSMNIGADADIGDIAKPDNIDEKTTIPIDSDDQMEEDGAGNED